jgi:dynein heavy chain, axonemal
MAGPAAVLQVMDLAVASPATVSRCGMVYMDAGQMGCRPLMLSWLAALPQHLAGAPAAHMLALYDWLAPVALRWLRREAREASPTLDGNLVTSLQRVVAAGATALPDGLAEQDLVQRVEGLFLFAITWSIGGTPATVADRAAFDAFLRAAAASQLKRTLSLLRWPGGLGRPSMGLSRTCNALCGHPNTCCAREVCDCACGCRLQEPIR